MIHFHSKPNFPYKIVLKGKDGKKFTYYSYDTEYLSYDDTNLDVEITQNKYDMPILPKQSSIFD